MALTPEENEFLSRVGPGTPCGELLRRYWHPVAITAKLDENPVQRVRILCEDLVLYRDRSGTLGLIGDRCAHRRVDLAFGIPETRGLRCPYHGFCYDETGQCIETPLESPTSRAKDSIKLTSYPVEELGGLVFAYLGPAPVPVLPRWNLFVRDDGFRQIFSHQLPCNWLQVAENRCDGLHVAPLHGRYFQYVLERQGRLTDDPDARYNQLVKRWAERRAEGVYQYLQPVYNQFGFTKIHLDSDQEQRPSSISQVGSNPILFPYTVAFGPEYTPLRMYQMGVPIDDTHTWHIDYDCFVFPSEVKMPRQETVPYAEVPIQDENGNYIVDTVLSQDMVSWYAQGEIADRPGEHLVASDSCVSAYRDFLSEQINKVERGEEPINVFHTLEEADRPELRIDGFDEELVEYTGAPTENVGGSYRVNYHKASKAGPLYIEDNIERYSPDRDVLLEAFRQYEAIWSKSAGRVLIHSSPSELQLDSPNNA